MSKPVVLIVDDEPGFGMRLKDAFALSSMWGCLFVDDLSLALRILREREDAIRVLLTDWQFTKGYSVKESLIDGVDLIKRAQAQSTEIKCFLMTAQDASPSFAKKIATLEGTPVLYKRDFQLSTTVLRQVGLVTPGSLSGSKQPWDVIASNVVPFVPLRARIGRPANVPATEAMTQGTTPDGEVAMTYVQELNSSLKVVKPIPAAVERVVEDGEDVFRASAPSLGLLVAGYGSDPLEAIKELQVVIADHYISMIDRNDLKGAAKHTQALLREFVTVRPIVKSMDQRNG